MNTKTGVILTLLVLGLCIAIAPVMADDNSTITGMPYAGDVQPYSGSIGPDSSLYGLKTAFENLDESFTFNQTEKLEKEVQYDNIRITELEAALAANRSDAADRAMDQYSVDLNRTEETLAQFNSTPGQPGPGASNGTAPWADANVSGTGFPRDMGPANAQQMILRHQEILNHLLALHPDNPGIARAYNNSLVLEQKFAEIRGAGDLMHNAGNVSASWPAYGNVDRQDRNDTGYTGNQTRENPGNTGNGQSPGQVNQTWQGQHGNNSRNTPGQAQQTPVNGQGNQNGNGPGNAGRNDNGNSDGNRDNRFHSP